MKKIFLYLCSIFVLLLGVFVTPGQARDVQDAASMISSVASSLEIPWEIVLLPNGDMLATERDGQLVRIGKDKRVIPIQGVEHSGEGGLLGLALHPNFQKNNFIYLYLTTRVDTGLSNRIERYVFQDDQLRGRTVIFQNIPGAAYHDGGRIAFGPDGYLYITTGDAGNERSAQNIKSLAGKILRITDNGNIPSDNPFKNAVYSFGHRNPQGIAWDHKGRMWATEHGRSGILSGLDELNLIEKGKNYGWPTIQGNQKKKGMKNPVIHSGALDTWAPADIVAFNDRLFFTGLRGEALYEVRFSAKGKPKIITHFKNRFGRLRALALGDDGTLYISTSNRDGRGSPAKDDDQIFRITLSALK